MGPIQEVGKEGSTRPLSGDPVVGGGHVAVPSKNLWNEAPTLGVTCESTSSKVEPALSPFQDWHRRYFCRLRFHDSFGVTRAAAAFSPIKRPADINWPNADRRPQGNKRRESAKVPTDEGGGARGSSMPGGNLSLSWLSSAVSIQDKDSDGHERGDGRAFVPAGIIADLWIELCR